MEYAFVWMAENWIVMLGVFYLAEKAVKLSPTKADDILVDLIIKGIARKLGLTRN